MVKSKHYYQVAIIDRVLRQNGGFLQEPDIAALAAGESTRLMRILVRCGGGRFTCPAQDVQHFVDIIGRGNSDYVRDVSIPADSAWRNR